MKLVPPSDPPEPPAADLVEMEGSTPFGSPVIDLDSVRIAYGLPRRDPTPCEHKSLVYNVGRREVWCKDCHRSIDGFDAFMTLVNQFHAMVRSANAKMARAEEAEKAVIVRRIAKDIDRGWGRKMARCCPHCGRGLLPSDFENHRHMVSFEYEDARRKRDRRKPTTPADG